MAETNLAKSEDERSFNQYRELVHPLIEGINPLGKQLTAEKDGGSLSLFLLLQYQQAHSKLTLSFEVLP